MEITSLRDIVLNKSKNLQQQLYRQIVAKVITGELAPGMRLPSSRRLADELSISRNTVIKTIEQLCDEGYTTSLPGSGVYIHDKLNHQQLTRHRHKPAKVFELPKLSNKIAQLNSLKRDENKNLPFSPGLTAIDQFPFAIWQQLLKHHASRKLLYGYNEIKGYLPLRQSLVNYLAHSRGVKCEPEQVIITQGVQHGINLCAQALLNPGDRVIVEEPGYISAKRVFESYQAEIRTVQLAQQSIDVDQLNQPKYRDAKLLYSTPTHQYPMGGILSADQRLALLAWAAENKTWLLEDDYDSEFNFCQKPVAAIQGLSDTAPVIYLGSFSKTLFPSIRLGYLVVPKAVSQHFSYLKGVSCGESPLVEQAVLAEFIDEGHFTRHIRRMRKHYHEKWQHLQQQLKQLPNNCQTVAYSAGMHLVLKIIGIDEHHLCQFLLNYGYAPSALSEYYYNSDKQTGLVLGFANTNGEQREHIVELINQYLKQQQGS